MRGENEEEKRARAVFLKLGSTGYSSSSADAPFRGVHRRHPPLKPWCAVTAPPLRPQLCLASLIISRSPRLTDIRHQWELESLVCFEIPPPGFSDLLGRLGRTSQWMAKLIPTPNPRCCMLTTLGRSVVDTFIWGIANVLHDDVTDSRVRMIEAKQLSPR
jgi:hypothetical protein